MSEEKRSPPPPLTGMLTPPRFLSFFSVSNRLLFFFIFRCIFFSYVSSSHKCYVHIYFDDEGKVKKINKGHPEGVVIVSDDRTVRPRIGHLSRRPLVKEEEEEASNQQQRKK